MSTVEVEQTMTGSLAIEYAVAATDPTSGQWPPASLIDAYVTIAHRHLRSGQMEDGRWFAEVVGLDGAWADGDTQQEAEDDLLDVLRGWIELKLEVGATDIPPMEGIDLNGV